MDNYPYDDRALEVSIHRYFAKRWVKGEWFTYDEEMLNDISTWPYFEKKSIVIEEWINSRYPSDREVEEIKNLLRDPKNSLNSIGRQYKVSRNTLVLIRDGDWDIKKPERTSRYI